MSLGLRLLAGLSDRSVSAYHLLPQLEAWVKSRCSILNPSTRIEAGDSSPSLFCRLHPAAEEFELSLIAPQQISVSANTSTVGPGYHMFLTSLLKDLAQEIGTAWEAPSDDSDEFGDETGFFFSGDEAGLQTEMTTWLAALANTFFDGTFDSDSQAIALCLPMNPQFESSQLAITPLGPRDREWLRRTATDGNQGTDFFAWWEPGFNSRYYLGRALAQMWTDVRWRAPASSQEELVLKDVADCLKTAYELDPNLDYPWAEWKEISEYLGVSGVATPGEAKRHSAASIGYRRNTVTVTLPGGWSIRIPGSFSDFEVDEQGDMFAVDPPFEIWFTAYRLEQSTPTAFKNGKNEMQNRHADEVIDRETYFAQATISERQRDTGERYFVLNSSNLAVGTRSDCTILFSNQDEAEWALGTWRSLKPPAEN
jgi:hypothetical protein